MRIEIINPKVPQSQMDTLSCCAPVYMHFKAPNTQEIVAFQNSLLLFLADGRNTKLKGEGTATAMVGEIAYEHSCFELVIFGDYVPAVEDLRDFFSCDNSNVIVNIDIREEDYPGALSDMYYDAYEFDRMDKLTYKPESGYIMGTVLKQVETWFFTDSPAVPCSVMSLNDCFENALELNRVKYEDRFKPEKWVHPASQIPAIGLMEVMANYMCYRIVEVRMAPNDMLELSVDASECLDDYSRRMLLDALVVLDRGLASATSDKVNWDNVYAALVSKMEADVRKETENED